MGNLVSLTELISSGKSGSFFYFTGDGKLSFINHLNLLKKSEIPVENHLKTGVFVLKEDHKALLPAYHG